LELETHVDQPRTFGLIFQALGFCPVFRYQKYRTQYASPIPGRAHCEVALDETPVGNFLEIEGSRAGIDRVARDLGYSRADYSTASYGALYLDQCRQANVKPGDMVFDTASSRANFLLREKTGKTS
jgi:adenylate cyclase class 2